MGKVLMVPEGYEKYKQEYLRKLKKGEVLDEDSKKQDLFYVA